MRCESLQGVWSPEALLVHEVLELLFVEEPSSIWSGASDGKLVRWSLDSEEAWPFALLCGHTDSIVGLATCSSSSSSGPRAVASVCLGGGICLWDMVTGRCSKRRQLPLSASQPAAIATVPGALRCVCVAYNSSSGLEGEPNKGGVLLVDVSTFTVLQTLSLGLGPVSAIVARTQGSEHGLVVADTQGRSRSWWGVKLEQEGETDKSVRPHGTPWDLDQGTKAESVALSPNGHYMLLVFRKHWLVGSRQDGSSFSAESQCNAGGCFLSTSQAQAERFLIWDVHGGATVYTLASHGQSAVEASVLCGIPPPAGTGIGVRFCSTGDAAVARVEFGWPAQSSLWGTRITLWDTSEGCLSNQEAEATLDEPGRKEELVSASMVLSHGKWQVPSAIVYGYETGRIQVVELQPPAEVVSKHSLLWHTGPILCLAAHYPESEQQILISGSMDCCLCIWDMKEGALLTVLHQHIAPVRQLILPSPETIGPWAQCFISVSEDGCVAISSLSSLRTERIFPGHAGAIKRAVWDEARGYLAVFTAGSGNDLLYIWDVHSGGKERVLRSTAAHSMLKHFLGRKKSMEQATSISTSVSSLLLPYEEQAKPSSPKAQLRSGGAGTKPIKRPAVRGGCLFPGIAAIQLDMSVLLAHKFGSPRTVDTLQEEQLLRTSLSVLHVWGVDELLDGSISRELLVHPPKDYQTGAGILGNRGAVSLVLPSKRATFELWRVSPEFCSLRVLTMVSLAQLLISISNLGSLICSALATFYSKTIFEKLGASCRPCLEVYIHFWQDPAEHVRLAARTLFHTAAENGVPDLLTNDDGSRSASCLLDWLESMDVPEWAAASGASYPDARAARIVMCGAFVVWYPALVRKDLAEATAPLLLKLVQATSDKHSATAAEILSAGMAKTWQPLIHAEIPHLIRDVLSLAQCLNAGDDTSSLVRNGLTAFLLPSLAAADFLSFLTAVRSSATTDPSLYLVGLPALVHVVQKSPLVVTPFLGQVVALALQGLSIAKPASLKDRCFFVALQTIRELVRAFPMVALYEDPVSPAAKLAVGDPDGDIESLAVHVYDIPSGSKVKLLDASGPPGHQALSRGGTSGITAASFSRDGEGLVAFSHRGLIIRWWSFEGNWWEKLNRGPLLVQCTKVVFVPPSAAFSPRSLSTSVLSGATNQLPTTTTTAMEEEGDSLVVDLSFRLEWRSDRVVALRRGAEEVGPSNSEARTRSRTGLKVESSKGRAMAELLEVHACMPSAERGQGILVDGDATNMCIAYCNGRSVILRSLLEPAKADVYCEHAYPTTVARFSPNGQWVASADVSGTVRVWGSGVEHPLKCEYRALSGRVDDLQWSADGERIVVCGDGKGKSFVRAIMWDTGTSIGEFDGSSRRVLSCGFKPTRPFRIATGGEDFIVNFYEGPPFKFKASHREHINYVNCVRFSPDGSRFITVGSDKRIVIYDGKSGDKLAVCSPENGHTGSIYAASWNDRSDKVLTASADKTAKIWTVGPDNSARVEATISFTGCGTDDMQVGCLWLKDFLITFSLGGAMNFLSPDSDRSGLKKVVSGHTKSITAVVISGTDIYSSSYDGVIVKWQLGNGYVDRLESKGLSSIDGLAVAGDALVCWGQDKALVINHKTGETNLIDLGAHCFDLSIAARSSSIAMACTEQGLSLLRDGSLASTVALTYQPTAVAVSPDGTTAVVGTNKGEIYLYSVAASTVHQKAVLERHRGGITVLKFSPDGSMFASGDQNREALVWDTASQAVKLKNMLYHTARLKCIAWSPGGCKVATGSVDGCVYVYDINKPASNRVSIKAAHTGAVSGLAFKDDNTLVTGGDDACLRVWSIR